MAKTIVTFFDNGGGDSKELEGLLKNVNQEKYHTYTSPISGPPALWVDDYELVGYTDVKRWLLKLAR